MHFKDLIHGFKDDAQSTLFSCFSILSQVFPTVPSLQAIRSCAVSRRICRCGLFINKHPVSDEHLLCVISTSSLLSVWRGAYTLVTLLFKLVLRVNVVIVSTLFSSTANRITPNPYINFVRIESSCPSLSNLHFLIFIQFVYSMPQLATKYLCDQPINKGFNVWLRVKAQLLPFLQ